MTSAATSVCLLSLPVGSNVHRDGQTDRENRLSIRGLQTLSDLFNHDRSLTAGYIGLQRRFSIGFRDHFLSRVVTVLPIVGAEYGLLSSVYILVVPSVWGCGLEQGLRIVEFH